MAASPQTATLVANTVKSFTFDRDYPEVEVSIIDNPSITWIRVDGVDPVAAAAGVEVLPAALSYLTTRVPTSGPTVVKCLSAGTPTVTVRGIPR